MIEENAKNIRLVLQLYKKSIPLHRVFHSIRFKVNKDWDSAEPLFFGSSVKCVDACRVERIALT